MQVIKILQDESSTALRRFSVSVFQLPKISLVAVHPAESKAFDDLDDCIDRVLAEGDEEAPQGLKESVEEALIAEIEPSAIWAMTMALTLPSVIVCLLFSDIGFGVDVYNVLYDFETLSIALYSILIALCISLFLCDVQRWQLWPKLGACVIGWALFVSATLLNGTSYPQGPLIVGLLHGPVLLGVIRYLLCIRVYSGVFYRAVYILAVVLGLLVLGLWLCWIVVENWDGQHYWNEDERTRLSLELDDLHKALKVDYILHCVKVAGGQGALSVDPEENNRLYEKCSTTLTTAYIVYVTPMIVSFTLLVLAVFCKLRAKNALVENGDALSNSQETEASLKTFVVFTSLLIMCFWIASSIAGSSSSMSGAVMGFAAAGSLVLFVWAFLSFGKARLVEAAHKSPLVASLLDMASSDWARALFICMVNVGLLIVVLLDFLRQCIRSLWWKDRPEKERGKLSGGMSEFVERLKGWHWGNVPVYVTAGIVISARSYCSDESDSSCIGFWQGTVVATILGFVLKLNAVVMQQKLIGEELGKSVRIQKFVGIDKPGIRAIEKILKQPGYSMAKVAILCGGPDWPTSVLTGIMRLSVVQMLLGTMPCIFLIIPCVLSGALLNRTGEGAIWSALASTVLAVAGLIQAVAMVFAAYILQNTAQKPEHEAVAELTRQEAMRNETTSRLTEWTALPTYTKILLVLAGSFSTLCFRPFELTDRISEEFSEGGLDGSVVNLLKPLGWLSLTSVDAEIDRLIDIGHNPRDYTVAGERRRRESDVSIERKLERSSSVKFRREVYEEASKMAEEHYLAGWMAREGTDDSIVKTTTAVIKKEEKQTPWRSDFKCGSGWPSDDGKREKSECNPDGEFPCCSTSGYRDRESHYKKFERHFADFVRELNAENRRNQEFHIFLIEQFDNQLFNRGWLFNVGFTEALRSLNEKQPDCIVMQDVDNLPMSGIELGYHQRCSEGIGDYATTNYCGEDVIPFANHNPEASK
ncbi:beta-1,4-galactosyltransferase, putative [Perkinsus marinus ATCC 50983]|uniref:Beta-1,4-galactosyltransferase, putative n=1 Tax=Perkinsus marinus (strain ATCC 50983 / TXsc) TaxID=423536 RepID=C5LE19_PERM5|nr:beta-1,4-galactosyltransferase, putative [Perkinsus marinus ATCC 50983]EER05017.1 beta-1,4-galactosyltransferase, putative [Perkinsus marinus ATCC 50983]|eukprot:XP_002773201.1 beta-1,4-galactosyltransferase, putative [Perkinsus marinus ATCC 50983]